MQQCTKKILSSNGGFHLHKIQLQLLHNSWTILSLPPPYHPRFLYLHNYHPLVYWASNTQVLPAGLFDKRAKEQSFKAEWSHVKFLLKSIPN